LGSVLGIINACHGLSINKQGGDLVMAGISEALVATALGLFIAIPAAAAYNYFVRLVKKIIVSSENFTRFLLMSFFSTEEVRKKHAFSNQK
jgi:biopolymer transport protein ExbB